jgi:hypothetical protein
LDFGLLAASVFLWFSDWSAECLAYKIGVAQR